MKHQFREAFEERKAELVEQGQWRGDKRPVRFAFGNTYSKVANPTKVQGLPGLFNEHRWVMFVCLNNNKDETQQLI